MNVKKMPRAMDYFFECDASKVWWEVPLTRAAPESILLTV
jgi:hypothetical protein